MDKEQRTDGAAERTGPATLEAVSRFSREFQQQFGSWSANGTVGPEYYAELLDRLLEVIDTLAARSLRTAERSRVAYPLAPAPADAA